MLCLTIVLYIILLSLSTQRDVLYKKTKYTIVVFDDNYEQFADLVMQLHLFLFKFLEITHRFLIDEVLEADVPFSGYSIFYFLSNDNILSTYCMFYFVAI